MRSEKATERVDLGQIHFDIFGILDSRLPALRWRTAPVNFQLRFLTCQNPWHKRVQLLIAGKYILTERADFISIKTSGKVKVA